ncbi:DNA replication complex GINS family protein [Candidatus Woesearchaeota archaeon]|nr:DNA replication complex GINS family protein [Candidatus Woesearchaeota archaeon]
MEKEGIITYEKLYEFLRNEKYKKELQKIDSDFFERVLKYLDEKKSILESQEKKDSVFASSSVAQTKRQLENTRMILKELYERREAKIIQMALFNSRTGERMQDVDFLLEEEVMVYNSLVNLFNSYRRGIVENILNGNLPDIRNINGVNNLVVEEKDENSSKLVRFLHPVPKFVGEDMQTYGPFETEDIANLPKKVSEILIRNNRAEEA